MSIHEKKKTSSRLYSTIKNATSMQHKCSILEELPVVKDFLTRSTTVKQFILNLNLESKVVVLSILALGQGPVVFTQIDTVTNKFEKLNLLLSSLLDVEKFYEGGLIGYYKKVVELIEEKKNAHHEVKENIKYHRPQGIDITQTTPFICKAIRLGLESLPLFAELYAVGGAAERLNWQDLENKTPLSAATFPFGGIALLEWLIRDVQAKEFLYWKLYGRVIHIPIVMMTSTEKENHAHILSICKKTQWFGRPPESFMLFSQPKAPVITENGDFALFQPLELHLKPGGHGVIWKLAQDLKVFDWLSSQGIEKLLIRQINNPVAGTDYGILAFIGAGIHHKKAFGFASCPRKLNAEEGMIVLMETRLNNRPLSKLALLGKTGHFCADLSANFEGISEDMAKKLDVKDAKKGRFSKPMEFRKMSNKSTCCITNIEYTLLKAKGLPDEPLTPESKFSAYPANTNILFADIETIVEALKKCPIPGMMINMKSKATVLNEMGEKHEVIAGRLESTMQNIADVIVDECFNEHLPLRSYVTYNSRSKTMSVTKRQKMDHSSLDDTPENCLYDMQSNHYELFAKDCKMNLPPVGSLSHFVHVGPPFLIHYHPALGPLYSIISQKIRYGCIEKGAELILDIAELDMEGLYLSGALHITAKEVLGHRNRDEEIIYSRFNGKCELKNVKVINQGLDHANTDCYWKNEPVRHEVLKIILHGNAEFYAEGVTLSGEMLLEVLSGHRMTICMHDGALLYSIRKIDDPTWFWEYRYSEDDRIELTKNRL